MTSPFEGYFARGLLSVWLSHGPETLVDEIDRRWPQSVQITDHGWAWAWFSNVPWLTAQAIDIKRRKKKLFLGGHSFGGTAAIMVAQNLAARGVAVDLLCPVDPAYQYTTVIPPNVQRVVGFYQRTPGQLGQGIDVEGNGWDDKRWKEQVDYRRVETHLQIIDDAFVRQKIIAELQKLAA